MPEFKGEEIGIGTIDALFIRYACSSVAYPFVTKGENDFYMHCNIIETRDDEFFKNTFLVKIASHDHHIPHDISFKGHACLSDAELRRRKRMRKEIDFGPDFITLSRLKMAC